MPAVCVTSPGQVTVQLPLLTVTVKLQVFVLFEESVAVQVTVVVPTKNLKPEGGSQTTVAQLPVAPGVA